MRAKQRLLGVAAGVLAACSVAAASLAQQRAPVVAQNAWARATTPGVQTGGVYVTLTSAAGDRLVGASSPSAAKAQLHEMQIAGGIMRMRPVEAGVYLPPGQPVTLAPSGLHLMLEGLRAPLRQGATVRVRLMFENAAPLDLEARVQAIGAAGRAPDRPGAGPAAMPGMSMAK